MSTVLSNKKTRETSSLTRSVTTTNLFLLPQLGLNLGWTSSTITTSSIWQTGALCCCFYPYPQSAQDIFVLHRRPFCVADHQQLMPTDNSLLSPIFSLLKTSPDFAFIFIPIKNISNCCISSVLYSRPKDRSHCMEIWSCSAINDHNYIATLHCPSC